MTKITLPPLCYKLEHTPKQKKLKVSLAQASDDNAAGKRTTREGRRSQMTSEDNSRYEFNCV
ncbi:hypothetical protein L484_003868 [Morus notabilis]|uniref:Uncharacterized protein n=1 Tax=Morus notabilis TaxID=981085 RepID=W9RBL8_9ROSA|nr:hypothetical protein L484_003868 [Morus notabilis]